jgi:hypothetical protein
MRYEAFGHFISRPCLKIQFLVGFGSNPSSMHRPVLLPASFTCHQRVYSVGFSPSSQETSIKLKSMLPGASFMLITYKAFAILRVQLSVYLRRATQR